jgi:hypothetical protein
MRPLVIRLGSGLVWCALSLLLWTTPASAHPMPESRVWVDSTATGLTLTLQLPLDRLEMAYGRPLAASPTTMVQAEREGLSRYVLAHVGARSGQQGWQAIRPQLSVEGAAPSAELVATLALIAPPGVDPRHTTLWLDAITHEIHTHRVLVFLRQDWASGHVAQAPTLLGEVRGAQHSVQVDLPDAGSAASWRSLWHAGLQHIAEGSDHLLFLVLLVLVAPFTATGERWAQARPARVAVRQVAWLVSAFTLGHMATLTLGSLGWLNPPSQLVEVAVALTIAVTAAHAMRPLLRAETGFALAFGLVHGLAFSASLSGAGLGPWQHAQAVLAFNLGIETLQMLVMALVLPPLLVLAHLRPAWAHALRHGTAVLALVASVQWVVERLGWTPWAEGHWLDQLAAEGLWLVLLLWLCALGSAAWHLRTAALLRHQATS